jgi:hypothetical protein
LLNITRIIIIIIKRLINFGAVTEISILPQCDFNINKAAVTKLTSKFAELVDNDVKKTKTVLHSLEKKQRIINNLHQVLNVLSTDNKGEIKEDV